jgi:hypothetical protein
MPYVRQKGNQICIVHGERNAAKQVEQKVLFTLYSQAEARAAIGPDQHLFRVVLTSDHPDLKIDWRAIESGIREHMDVLPEVYAYKERTEQGFRDALVALTKELLIADPQHLVSYARMLKSQRHELEHLRALIDFRLRLCARGRVQPRQLVRLARIAAPARRPGRLRGAARRPLPEA